MELIPFPICVSSAKNVSPLHKKTGRKMSTHIVRCISLLKICLLFMGLHLAITRMLIIKSQYSMSLYIIVHILSTSSLTPIRSVSIDWTFMITPLKMKSFMFNWMMTWRYLSNLRGIYVLLYCVFRHKKSLKHAIILIWWVITSGKFNQLTLMRFTRYHNPEQSRILSSK